MKGKPKRPLAYELHAQDDDSYMLGGETFRPDHRTNGFFDWRFGRPGAPHPATCAVCGRKIQLDYVNAEYRVKKRRRDFTCTYDGYLLVSKRARSALQAHGAKTSDFVALPNDQGYFWLRPTRVVAYEAGETGNRCPSCKHHHDVHVPIPVFIDQRTRPVGKGVYRSSVEFASGHEQSPIVVVGVATASALLNAGLVGLELSPLARAC